MGLGDLLLWYGLVADGVLLQHDGSLLAAWSYRGPDLQSATHAEMNAIATRLASILRLGSGWMVQVDAFRTMANEYGPRGAFPDRVTRLIDEERRVQFQSEGSHFESEYFLTLTYLPPMAAEERLRGFMISGAENGGPSSIGADALRYFSSKARQFEEVFSSQFPVRRLRAVSREEPGGFERVDDELLSYLRRCLTGIKARVMQPEIPVFLNDMLAMEDFLGGMEPMLGDRHVRVLSVDGFPRSTWPGALSVLDTVGCEYRWHTRIILMDSAEAQGIIEKTRRKWRFQTRGFKDQVFKSNGGATNLHAVEMAADAEGALSEAAAGDVQFGYFSSSIVLQHSDLKFLETMIGEFRKALINRGFGVRIEAVNAVDAFFGTMPGNRTAQVRRPHGAYKELCRPHADFGCVGGRGRKSVRVDAAEFTTVSPRCDQWRNTLSPQSALPGRRPHVTHRAYRQRQERLYLPTCQPVVPISGGPGLRLRQRTFALRTLQSSWRPFLRHRGCWLSVSAAQRYWRSRRVHLGYRVGRNSHETAGRESGPG